MSPPGPATVHTPQQGKPRCVCVQTLLSIVGPQLTRTDLTAYSDPVHLSVCFFLFEKKTPYFLLFEDVQGMKSNLERIPKNTNEPLLERES